MLGSRFLRLRSAVLAGVLLLTPFFASAQVSDNVDTAPRQTAVSVAVNSPVSGQAVSGNVTLSASTNVTVSGLRFSVFTMEQGAERVIATVPASPGDANGMSWNATWASTSATNGGYFVRAIAMQDGTETPSPVINFTVANQTTAPPQNDALSINIIEPAISARVSGNSVTFKAQTSGQAGSLTFTINGSTSATLPATGDGNGTIWIAHWDSTSVQNGSYNVRASVPQPGAAPAQSDIVGFLVDNGPPAGSTPFTVNITLPPAGQSLSGTVAFNAQTSLDAAQVTFVVNGQNLSEPRIFLAVNGGDGKTWNKQVDTTTVPDGTYSAVAKARRGDGTEVTSPAITFSIANQTNTAAFSVTRNAPAPAASLSGRVELSATTSGPASSVTFRAALSATSAPLSFAATPDANGTRWTAFWETTNAQNGTYALRVTAVSPSGQTVETSPITVAVNNPSSESALSIEIVTPASAASVTGTVGLHATTSAAADSLVFAVRDSQNRIIASLPAAPDAARTSWSANWDSMTVANGTYSLFAKAFKGTTPVETPARTMAVSNPVEDRELLITVVSPKAAATISGVVLLRAATNIAAENVRVVIRRSDASETFLTLVAGGNTERTAWTASWDTTKAPNGTYTFVFQAPSGTQTVSTSPLTVAVSNSSENVLTVALSAPQNGAELRGTVHLVAASSLAADSLKFTVMPASGNAILIDGIPDAQKKVWAADWNSLSVPNGSYLMGAAALRGATRAESGAINVRVSNDAGATTPPPSTTTPPTTVAPPPAETTEPPKTETPTETPEPLVVNFVTPQNGATVKGALPISLRVSGRPSKVSLILRSIARNETVGARDAVFSASSGAWGAIWDTSRHMDGSYAIIAAATDASGQRVEARVAVTVANQAPQETTLPSAPVTIIPREVAIETITELPEGTTALMERGETPPSLGGSVQANLDAVAGVEAGLDKECADLSVPAEKCEQFLAFRHQASECREAGIVTKEECVRFMNLSHGGRPAECEGKTDQECREITARLTAGLLSNERLDKIEDAVLDRIGEVIRIAPKPEGERPDTGELQGDELIEDNVPLVSRREMALRVHAANGYGEVDGLGVRQVPAVLVADSDGDGLPDDLEKRLGTDPRKADSDGDGFSDWTEVKNGYNPLGEGKLADDAKIAPIDRAIIAGAPLEQPTTEGEVDDSLHVDVVDGGDAGTEAEGSTVLNGRAEPGSIVTIFIYSYLPVVLTTTTDGDGNWSYELDGSLTDGQHEAYVTVTDDTGKITKKSNPLSFFVSEAQAADAEDYFGTQAVDAANADAPVQQAFRWYGFAAAGLVIAALIFIGLYTLRRMKKAGTGPTV